MSKGVALAYQLTFEGVSEWKAGAVLKCVLSLRRETNHGSADKSLTVKNLHVISCFSETVIAEMLVASHFSLSSCKK